MPFWLQKIVYRKVYKVKLVEMLVNPGFFYKKDGKIHITPPEERLVPIKYGPGRYWWQIWKPL